jgi:tetratricopeptide (TPR) repeat protein
MLVSRKPAWWSVLFILLSASLTAGEVPQKPTVGHGPGLLAVQESAAKPWQIVDDGTTLPPKCSLRTASAGPCSVQVPGGKLVVDSDTRFSLESDEHAGALEAGCLFLETTPEHSWTVSLGDRRITVQPDSAAELCFHPPGVGKVSIVRGMATCHNGKQEQIAAGKHMSWSSGKKGDFLPVELLNDDLKKIQQRWAEFGKRPQGLGQLLIKDSQSGEMDRLNIARYHVNVVLQPSVALVQIDQSFYNPYNRQEEGTFVFNLPQGASVSRFAMYVTPNQLVEGELIERQRARNIYQSIVDRRRDPAILEQIGDNLFRMRVFPVFAKDTKRILLDYTIPLKQQRGEYRFHLPLLSDLEPIWGFRLSGTIRGMTHVGSLSSLSHPELPFQGHGDGRFTFELKERLYQPATDFHLNFNTQDNAKVRLRSHLAAPLPLPDPLSKGEWSDPWSHRSATYFMLSIPPDLQEQPAPSKPADVLILADTSSGMHGVGLVKQSLQTIVHNLRASDRFRLTAVDVAARPLHDGWIDADTEQAEAVVAQFDRQFCLGGTNLAASLRKALQSFPNEKADRKRVVIYIGDGEDQAMSSMSTQISVQDLIADLRESNASFAAVVARRSSEGYATLDRVTRATGGLVFDLPGSPSGHRDLFRWLLAGLPDPQKIERVDVEGAAAQDLLYPASWLPGDSLHILGRVPWSDEIRLRLTTSRAGKRAQREWELPADNGAEDVFVGRLWAQQKLDQLRRQEPSTSDGSIRDQIIGLSQQWSLLSPYTAFLVLESEADYRRWNVDRRVRRRYWKPADALPTEPLPKDWLARVTPGSTERVGKTDARRVARAIEAARQAVEDENFSLAHGLLHRVRRLPAAQDAAEFQRLYDRVAEAVRQENLLQGLGPHRGLFDPHARAEWNRLKPQLAPLLMGALGGGAEFSRRHPHARQLLADFPVQPRLERDGFNLEELTDILAGATGTNVVLDHLALEDVNLSPNSKLGLYGIGQMSLRNYVRFVLSQIDLVMIEEPNRILLTTEEEAELRRGVEVYPLADLYLTNRVSPLDLLANPYLDRNQAAEARIRAKLERPISVKFSEAPLTRVVEHLASVLNDTVIIDRQALEDVALPMTFPITAHWKDVPAKQALAWMLEQEDLDYYIADEAIVITTPDEKEMRLKVRLHSGRGIVFQYPVAAEQPGLPPSMMGAARFFRDAATGFRPNGGAMGSFFAGGMGGGFGGGMGGMMGGMGAAGASGGGLGGLGGGFSAAQPRAGSDEAFGVDPALTQAEPAETSQDEESIPPFADTEETASAPMTAERFEYDTDSVISQVTATIAPETWEDVGGPGSLAFFPQTLDFVFSQTDDVHEQIEALFGTLRGMPTLWQNTEMQPGETRSVSPDDPWSVDIDGLISLITTTVRPYSWEDVGGPCTIAPDLPRLALVVSGDQETQDCVYRLLTLLRRSRYAAQTGTMPWEASIRAAGGAMAGGETLNALSTDLQVEPLSKPTPDEMEALQVRREPTPGIARWQCVDTGDESERALEIRLGHGRLEIRRTDVVFRVVDEAAAIAYPGLRLVEHGKWGEAVRQLADVWLPWLPHRSNRELASWFHIEHLDRKDAKHPELVFLRLRPHGSPEDSGVYMEVAFSTRDGRPRVWEYYRNGERAGRLRFIGANNELVVLVDPSGRQLARWELTTRQTESPGIADLTEDWEGYVQLDRRSERPTVDRAFAEALAAMHRFEWDRVLAALGRAGESHPQHPLLQLLTAWCLEQRPDLSSPDAILEALRQVAAGEATALTRFIDRANFPSLDAGLLLDILARQPKGTRSAADLDRLGEAATDAGWYEEALTYTELALAKGGSDVRQFQRNQRWIELLLRLERADEAIEWLNAWSENGKRIGEQLAAMAEILARYGHGTTADKLFAKALDNADLTRPRRYELLVRQAEIHTNERRWRILLEAASLQAPDSAQRGQCLAKVLTELDWGVVHAEMAGVLADEAEDLQIRRELRLRQAELTASPAESAEILWGVFKSGRLPESRLAWACRRWNDAARPNYVIQAAENRLRSSHQLSHDVRMELAVAYRSQGQLGDSQRASTSDRPPSRNTTGRRDW